MINKKYTYIIGSKNKEWEERMFKSTYPIRTLDVSNYSEYIYVTFPNSFNNQYRVSRHPSSIEWKEILQAFNR